MNNRKKISKYISIRSCPVTPFEGCKKYISTGDSDDFSNGEIVTFQNRPSRANLQPLVDDILFAKMKKTNKVILIDEETQELIFSTGFFAIDPLFNHPRYIYFLCQSDEFNKEKDSLSFGTTQEALNERRFKQMNISFVTDFCKQSQIARYLDAQVGHLDQLINNQQRVIEEWKAYKQSLITETVTKGLNPEVELKDSGIEWIGAIPSHWEVKKIKHLFTIKKEIAGKLGFDVLSVTQRGLKVKDISKNEGQLSNDYSKYQLVNVGDFVMNHMDLLTGWVDYSMYKGVTSPDYRVFKLKSLSQHCAKYYLYIMQVCYKNKIFYNLGQGVSNLGRWRLQTNTFLNFFVQTPPFHEQQQIADFLDEKCSKIDQLIEDKQRLIEDLKAYKQSLIYECVTGKKEIV